MAAFELPDGVSKRIVSEGLGSKRPCSGDEVHVTFIGWIKAQAEDVEFHRLEEFHFTMGAQEVNQGMDLGVATMRKGEVAMLDLSPEFAYGAEGVPGKIPPHCALTFQVTLLWWKPPGASALTADGGVLKSLRRAGSGPKPGSGSTVVLRAMVAMEDGQQELGTLEGQVSDLKILELPARTLEICVTSMLESEKAEMTLAAPYLGDSSACSMSLELELLKVMVVQECSYFKEKTGEKNFPKMTQKWLQEGVGSDKPTALSKVTALVDGRCYSWTLMLGDPEDLPKAEAVECGLLNMTVGARCEVSVAHPEQLSSVVVELRGLERTPNAWSTPHKKLENCELLKSSAAAFMKSKDFRRACKVYQLVQDFLGYTDDWAQDDKDRADILRRACKSNEVMAWIKLEQFRNAADLCTELLEGGGDTTANPKDIKAIFRRGVAYIGLGEAKLATKAFQEILADDPKNNEARAYLTKAKDLEKEQSKNSGDLFKGMMGAAGSFGYPVGFSSTEGDREREREAMMNRLEELKAKGPLVI